MTKLGLMILDGIAEEFPIKGQVTSIGRSPDCDVRIDHTSVSRKHAVIWQEPGTPQGGHCETYIDDLNSRNGTLVNGLSISRHRLRPEDEITIGCYRFSLFDDNG